MTEIYQISPDASLEGLRRALGQWRGKRVALLLPADWLELGNVARLRLLQRQAIVQQVELALITTERSTRKAAKQVGIPVFRDAEAASRRAWRMDPLLPPVDVQQPDRDLPEPPPWRRLGAGRQPDTVQRIARPTLYQARQARIRKEMRYRQPSPVWLRWAGNLLLGALIVLALGAFSYYVLPAATITLTPGRVPLTTDLNMQAVVGLEAPDPQARQLPARSIKADLVETGTVPTTGSQQKATDRAAGEVVFSNLGSAPVTIPTGTSVSTSTGTPVEFRTTRDALLESGVGTRVTVPIEAIEPGTLGNVQPNTINTVNGSLRFRVRVSNPGGTYGGGSALTPVVTETDRDNLAALLLAQAEQKAYDALAAELEPGEWLPPESVQTFIVAQSFDQYNDEESLNLTGTLRVLAQALAVDEAEASNIILAAVEQQVPANARLVADSLAVSRLPGAEFLTSSVSFTMTVAADYTTPIDAGEVRDAVMGLPPDEAAAVLKDRWLLASEPDIYLDPAWKGSLPNIGSRIQVRVDYGPEQ
jgi:hypothetical protein